MMLLEQMLQLGRFAEFIDELFKIRNEELEEKTKWEYYLHRVYDKSFDEFMKQTEPKKSETIGKEEMTAIVRNSLDILARQ